MAQATKTSHPFTKDTADIILRTADGVEFRVHKLILSEASPVFSDMFTLPQPEATTSRAAAGGVENEPPTLPVVDLTETSEVVERLLRLCYPMPDPVLELDAIGPVVQAAKKYDMQWAVSQLGQLLNRRAVLDDPERALRAFVIASNLDLPEAEEAARASLRLPFQEGPPDVLYGISTSSLYRLLEYRRRVRAAVVQFLMNSDTEWSFTNDLLANFTLNGVYHVGPYERMSAIVLPFNSCRMAHDRCYNDQYMGEDPDHEFIPIDEPYVIQELVKQTEELHNVFALQIPKELLSEALRVLPCEECRVEGMNLLRDFFNALQDALRDVMFKVPLDHRY